MRTSLQASSEIIYNITYGFLVGGSEKLITEPAEILRMLIVCSKERKEDRLILSEAAIRQ